MKFFDHIDLQTLELQNSVLNSPIIKENSNPVAALNSLSIEANELYLGTGSAKKKILSEAPTLQLVSDSGGLTNDSTIREGSKDFYSFGGGISLVCSMEKELQWQNGVQYYFEVGQSIVYANSMLGNIPDNKHL